MRKVPTTEKRLGSYAGIAPVDLLAHITQTAEQLKGLRVVHVSATPSGGGVAEILKSLVPLMQSVGIETEWYVIEPDELFFDVSKALHHCLQGDSSLPSHDGIELFLAHNKKAACALTEKGVTADLWLVHDVQVLPLLHYMGTPPGVWICHIDATRPDGATMKLLQPYIDTYQRIVVSMPEYALADCDPDKLSVFPPAIDPLVYKNALLPVQKARKILAKLGIDSARPLATQVSRFDRWKDPWGVVDAYRLAKQEIKGLQLALVGAMSAKDDPDALAILNDIQQYTKDDPDIHLFSDPLVIGDLEVRAFQSGSDVILQKSTREGFGLTVTEAMWKKTPVIGGNCGGIRHQILDGENGFLVDDTSSCASVIVTILKDQALARRIAKAGRDSVRENYLMPRLLKDYLELILDMSDHKSLTIDQSELSGAIKV